jgi:hypothetical protein
VRALVVRVFNIIDEFKYINNNEKLTAKKNIWSERKWSNVDKILTNVVDVELLKLKGRER